MYLLAVMHNNYVALRVQIRSCRFMKIMAVSIRTHNAEVRTESSSVDNMHAENSNHEIEATEQQSRVYNNGNSEGSCHDNNTSRGRGCGQRRGRGRGWGKGRSQCEERPQCEERDHRQVIRSK